MFVLQVDNNCVICCFVRRRLSLEIFFYYHFGDVSGQEMFLMCGLNVCGHAAFLYVQAEKITFSMLSGET